MKTASERPNAWYVIVTLIALLYWGYFSWSLLFNTWLACHSEYQDAYPHCGVVLYFIMAAAVFALIWIYLIRDLIKQVSLFFRNKTK